MASTFIFASWNSTSKFIPSGCVESFFSNCIFKMSFVLRLPPAKICPLAVSNFKGSLAKWNKFSGIFPILIKFASAPVSTKILRRFSVPFGSIALVRISNCLSPPIFCKMGSVELCSNILVFKVTILAWGWLLSINKAHTPHRMPPAGRPFLSKSCVPLLKYIFLLALRRSSLTQPLSQSGKMQMASQLLF